MKKTYDTGKECQTKVKFMVVTFTPKNSATRHACFCCTGIPLKAPGFDTLDVSSLEGKHQNYPGVKLQPLKGLIVVKNPCLIHSSERVEIVFDRSSLQCHDGLLRTLIFCREDFAYVPLQGIPPQGFWNQSLMGFSNRPIYLPYFCTFCPSRWPDCQPQQLKLF